MAVLVDEEVQRAKELADVSSHNYPNNLMRGEK